MFSLPFKGGSRQTSLPNWSNFAAPSSKAQTLDPDPPPLGSYQADMEKLCTGNRRRSSTVPTRLRSYRFREWKQGLGRQKSKSAGMTRWPRIFPFLGPKEEKYTANDLRLLLETYGARPLPIGESPQSRKIRLDFEEKIKDNPDVGEKNYEMARR